MKSDFCKRMDGLCLQSPSSLDTVKFKFNIECSPLRYQEENCTSRSLVRNYKTVLPRSNVNSNNFIKKTKRGTTTPISHSPKHLKQINIKEDMRSDLGLKGMAFSTKKVDQEQRKSPIMLYLPDIYQSCGEPLSTCRRLRCHDRERLFPMVRYSSSDTRNVIDKLDLTHSRLRTSSLELNSHDNTLGSNFKLISNKAQFHSKTPRNGTFS